MQFVVKCLSAHEVLFLVYCRCVCIYTLDSVSGSKIMCLTQAV